MLVLKSDQYRNKGYRPEQQLWEFERIATPNEPEHQEFLLTSDVKFVEKSSDTVTLFRPDGSSVVTTLRGIKQQYLTV